MTNQNTAEQWHKGKVAIVTGGTAGIGLAIAQTLKKRGAKVSIGGRKPARAYADLAAKFDHVGQLDVAEKNSVENYVEEVRNQLGSSNILVNCAGISVHQEICGHSEEDWLDVINVNLNGPFRMTRELLPAMIAKKWGRIVNIASTAATTAATTHPAYCASKTGLLGLSRATALEGAPHGVTCTTVSPTWVETQMLHDSMAKMAKRSGQSIEQQQAEVAAANPQNRLVQPEEIAELISFLCSDLSPALTMEDIQVNAGAWW